jgi:electron transport complex protein RnfA
MTDLFATLLGACLVNNLALHHLLALAPAAALSRRIDVAAGFSLAVSAIIILSTPLAWLLDTRVLQPLGLFHLRTVAFLILIVAVTSAGLPLLARLRPLWHNQLAVCFPLALLNSGVLGAALLTTTSVQGFGAALAYALGTGAGYTLICVLFAGLQERVQTADVPVAFQGVPVQLLIFAILSMAFMGFAGLGGS